MGEWGEQPPHSCMQLGYTNEPPGSSAQGHCPYMPHLQLCVITLMKI